MAASARIDELRSKFDDNPRRYFAPLANEYRKAGDLETAIAICRTQLRHFPTHMSGHVVLGQALFEAGQLAEARTAMRRAVELDPENVIALRHLGDIARTLGDDADARLWYQRVLDADPYNAEIAAYLNEPVTAEPVTIDPEEPAADQFDVEVVDAEVVAEPDPVPAAQAAEPVSDDFVDLAADDFVWAPPVATQEEEVVVEAHDNEPPVGLDVAPQHDEALDQLIEIKLEPLVEETPAEAAAEPPVDWAIEGAQPLAVVATGAFATETMAQLCIQQGHDEEALAIYERLVAQRPDDADLAARAAAVRERVESAADAPRTEDFLRTLAEHRPPEPAAGDAAPSERDDWATSAWAEAFRPDPAPPTVSLADEVAAASVPADDDLSFDRFFVGLEEEDAPAATSEPNALAVAVEAPPAPVAAPESWVAAEARAEIVEESDEDLAAFNAWLRGLRDS